MNLFKVIHPILLFICILFIMNCHTVKQNTSINSCINFRIIESGAYGGFSYPFHMLVKNKKDFDSLFTEFHKNVFPIVHRKYSPKKDYIFITFGEKSNGGLEYSVHKVERKNQSIIVKLQTIQENRTLLSTDAIATPYIIAEIVKTNSNNVYLKLE